MKARKWKMWAVEWKYHGRKVCTTARSCEWLKLNFSGHKLFEVEVRELKRKRK